MKTLLAALSLLLPFALPAKAFLAPTNPPPSVTLGWTISSDPAVTNYFIYWGTASGQYTNKLSVGNVNQATIATLTRGTTYFFAVTAFSSNGLESAFSNEVSWTPANPPAAPTLRPPVTLSVITKPSISSQWVDAGMNWTLTPGTELAYYGLRIGPAQPQVTTQMKAQIALREKMLMPTTANIAK